MMQDFARFAFGSRWSWTLLLGILLTPLDAALAAPGGADRPHLGRCDTVIPPPPPSFPAVVVISTTCRFRHLGLTTGTIVQVLDVAGPPSPEGVLPLTITQGAITYVAANGHELHATFEGSASIAFATGDITFEGVETFVGGTGRFADASGTSFLEGDASASTLTGFYVTRGALSY